jgi:hypothetical protein
VQDERQKLEQAVEGRQAAESREQHLQHTIIPHLKMNEALERERRIHAELKVLMHVTMCPVSLFMHLILSSQGVFAVLSQRHLISYSTHIHRL